MVKIVVSQQKTSTLGYFREVGAIKNVNRVFLKIVKVCGASKILVFVQFSPKYSNAHMLNTYGTIQMP